MAGNDTNCAPCADCPPTPAPVMSRCNVVLPDGVYAWATVTVENGCITAVAEGLAPLYTPDICCPGGTTGGGEGGLDGPPGPPGQNATITIGAVTSLAAGSAPTVTNTGTASNAILNFGIPRGEDGADGDGATVGVTDNRAGIEIVNGVIKTLPVQWPPVLGVTIDYTGPLGVTINFTEDPLTGVGTLVFDMQGFVNDLTASFQAEIDTLTDTITTMQGQMSALQTQLVSVMTALQTCCPGAVIDIDGDGTDDPGGTPGVSPSPPVATN